MTIAELRARLAKADTTAVTLVRDAAAHIGALVAMLVHFYNPARVTNHHPLRVRRGAAAAIAWPRSPAKRSAKGSLNSASWRADSAARYAAIQRAVSDTFEISGSGMAHSFPGPCTSTAAVLRRSKHRKVLS